jgi:2-polyprenyl-3-methyl-5-hydroxy-6-metoxy-1,4-benzoquinol methylase
MTKKREYEVTSWENTTCPVCHAEACSVYERFGYKLKFTYVRCKICRTVYQNPRPIYNSQFVEEAYEDYADGRWYHDVVGYYEKNALQFDKEIDEILLYDRKNTAMLDIGPGVGLFLFSAKKKYPVCNAIEISRNLSRIIEQKLGVSVYTGTFETFDAGRKFSCINMSHVIEHVPNPNQWLQKAISLLDTGGILVVDVPNWFSWAQRLKWFLKKIGLRRGEWPPEKIPEHLYEPGFPGMNQLFRQNGLEILDFYTYSRKDLISEKFPMKIFHRRFRAGSNLRFYLKTANVS